MEEESYTVDGDEELRKPGLLISNAGSMVLSGATLTVTVPGVTLVTN